MLFLLPFIGKSDWWIWRAVFNPKVVNFRSDIFPFNFETVQNYSSDKRRNNREDRHVESSHDLWTVGRGSKDNLKAEYLHFKKTLFEHGSWI